ncbi:hypothetical protein [Jeongeupia sp. HS-3]|uniref:hypothetical protein n=1 Tax=Jeongeupia sp. HS-3 TaxID=1009682 RepID=UPI001910D485|nr:hypothetical protein [Jeongeupia sp. HS-3]
MIESDRQPGQPAQAITAKLLKSEAARHSCSRGREHDHGQTSIAQWQRSEEAEKTETGCCSGNLVCQIRSGHHADGHQALKAIAGLASTIGFGLGWAGLWRHWRICCVRRRLARSVSNPER